MRVSNLPTTFTNVMVGATIGAGGLPEWSMTMLVAAAIALLYLGGMALNDVADAGVDASERPGRPIPSGRISKGQAAAFIVVVFAIGLTILAWLGWPALTAGAALVALIIAYDLQHHRFAWGGGSVILMGLCRGMVYVTAASAMAWPVDWSLLGLFAGVITLYTTLLTLVSRQEHAEASIEWRRWLAVLMPLVPLACAVAMWPGPWRWSMLALVAMLAWLARGVGHVFANPPRTKLAVMTWLAGMCLVDAWFLTLLDQPLLAAIAVAAFVITALGHRRILGT